MNVRFGKTEYPDDPPVHHRHVRIVTRRRVYFLGFSWGNR